MVCRQVEEVALVIQPFAEEEKEGKKEAKGKGECDKQRWGRDKEGGHEREGAPAAEDRTTAALSGKPASQLGHDEATFGTLL